MSKRPGLLVIAFKYPDLIVTGGSTRVEKFVKYLPGHGWRPHVLSVRLPEGSLTEDVHHGPFVHRTPSHYPAFVRTYRARYTRATSDRRKLRIEVLRRLKNLVAIPDDTVLWWPRALPSALSLIRRHRLRAVFASGPPFSSLLLAAIVAKIARIPCVADLRDDWADTVKGGPRNLVQRLTEKRFERLAMGLADRVIHVTQGSRDLYRARYPGLAARMEWIANGYDEDDFTGIAQTSGSTGKLTILHAGTLKTVQSPKALFAAMRRLRDEDVRFGAIRFIQVGTSHCEHEAAARELGVEDQTEWREAVPRPEMVRMMSECDALLLIPTPGVETQVPGKTYEYLRSGRQVLVLAGPGEVRRLVEGMRGVEVLEPGDGSGLVSLLARWFDSEARRGPEPGVAREYSRDRLAGRLSTLLREVLREREPDRRPSS